jgi:hypothetical protein
MALQYSVTHRTNAMSDISTQVGTSGLLKIFTGAPPANCGTADTGTLLATLTCNATAFGAAATGVLTANAITSATAAGTGTAGYFRIYPSAATTTNAVTQGLVFASTTLVTSAATAAGSNVLTFAASGTNFVAGMLLSGTGILPGTYVLSSTATTVTMSQASTAGVAITTTITAQGDLTLSSTAVSAGQTVSVTSMTITAFGA